MSRAFAFRQLKFFTLLLALAVLFASLPALSINAQDVAPEATDVVSVPVEVTPAPVEVTPIPVTPAPVTPVFLTPENSISLTTLVYVLIVSILGGGTINAILGRFSSNKSALDAAEKLYLAQPPEAQRFQQELIGMVFSALNKTHDVLSKVMDGKPNEVVLAQAAQVSSPDYVTRVDLENLRRQLEAQIVNTHSLAFNGAPPEQSQKWVGAGVLPSNYPLPTTNAIGKAIENLPEGEALDVPMGMPAP